MNRLHFLLLIVAAAAPPISVWAQSSSVSLTGATVASGSALEIRDSEYPLPSLLANQEGDVKLSFTVDAAGHAADIRILSSSGSQLLDLQSSRLVGSKWTFQSAQPDRTAEMTISWKVPLERVSDFDVKLPSPGADSPARVQITSHAVQANDFPGASLRNGEAGTRYSEPEAELRLLLEKLRLQLPAQPSPKITAAATRSAPCCSEDLGVSDQRVSRP